MQALIPFALVSGVMLTVGLSFLSLLALFYRDSPTICTASNARC